MFSLGFEKKKNQVSPKSLLSIKQTSVQKKKKFPGMLSKTYNIKTNARVSI